MRVRTGDRVSSQLEGDDVRRHRQRGGGLILHECEQMDTVRKESRRRMRVEANLRGSPHLPRKGRPRHCHERSEWMSAYEGFDRRETDHGLALVDGLIQPRGQRCRQRAMSFVPEEAAECE